jgi:acyl-CoA thioester hydrolase
VTTVPLQVRFGDLDPRGHINNVAYFAYLETARVEFLRALRPSPIGSLVVARAECDFLVEIPGRARQVDVTVAVEAIGRTSFTLAQEVRLDGTLHARGRTVLVVVGDDARPRALTTEERGQLEEHLNA